MRLIMCIFSAALLLFVGFFTYELLDGSVTVLERALLSTVCVMGFCGAIGAVIVGLVGKEEY